MSDQKAFDPGKHLSKVKGQDYLEVKWRVVWFREEWPHGKIETQVIDVNPDFAVLRAEIYQLDENGTMFGSATSHGFVEKRAFESYVEKAETKAIGRALAVLGYGTQFTDDAEFGNGYANTNGVQGPPPERPAPARAQAGRNSSNGTITDTQKKAVRNLQSRLGWSDEKLQAFVGNPVGTLAEDGAGRLIKDLNKMLTEGERG